MKYYVLRQDMSNDRANGWYFGAIRHLDNWRFIEPHIEDMEPCTYTVNIFQDGNELDFSQLATISVPIVSKKFKQALAGLWEVDEPYKNIVMEPVVIAGKEGKQDYFVMIVETQIDCVDEEKSDFEKFENNDPVRPDLAGEYRGFFSLVIDPSKVGDHHIFRIKKSSTTLIVSEEVKRRIEAAGVTGASFESVNGDARTVA